MVKQKNKNARIPIKEIDKKLNIDSFYDLSPDVIDLAYEEAKDRVVALASGIDLIQERMMTLLGWLSAAEISLVGVLVGLVVGSAGCVPFWMCLYGVVFLGAIIFYLVGHGLYGTEVIVAGDMPDNILDSETVEKLKALVNKNEQQFYLKIRYLSLFQEAAQVNMNTNNRLVHVYRSVMWSVLAAVAVGAVLLIVLTVVL